MDRLARLRLLGKGFNRLTVPLLVALVGVGDYLTGLDYSFDIVYLVPVVGATVGMGRRAGLLTAASASLVRLGADFVFTTEYSHPAIPVWSLLVVAAFLGLTVVVVGSLKEAWEYEARRAAQIQRSQIPQELPEIEGLSLAQAWHPWEFVGGDFFDVAVSEGRDLVRLSIADAMGHGIPAALLAAQAQSALRILAGLDLGPAALTSRLDELLRESTPLGSFVTFFLAELDPVSGECVYVNAGHPPPLLRQADGVARLAEGGPALGLLPQGTAYREGRITMSPGSLLVLFTDGVIEATSPGREMFGDERLIGAVERAAGGRLEEVPQAILDRVLEFSRGAPGDDVTVVVVKRSGSSGSAE